MEENLSIFNNNKKSLHIEKHSMLCSFIENKSILNR